MLRDREAAEHAENVAHIRKNAEFIGEDIKAACKLIFFCAFICIDDGFIYDLAKKKGDQYVFCGIFFPGNVMNTATFFW